MAQAQDTFCSIRSISDKDVYFIKPPLHDCYLTGYLAEDYVFDKKVQHASHATKIVLDSKQATLPFAKSQAKSIQVAPTRSIQQSFQQMAKIDETKSYAATNTNSITHISSIDTWIDEIDTRDMIEPDSIDQWLA